MARIDKLHSLGFFSDRAAQFLIASLGAKSVIATKVSKQLRLAAAGLRKAASAARTSPWRGVAGRSFAKGAEKVASRMMKGANVIARAEPYMGAVVIGKDLALVVTAENDQEMLDNSKFLAADIAVTASGIAASAGGALGLSAAAFGVISGVGAVVVLLAGLAMLYYEYERVSVEAKGIEIACKMNKKLLNTRMAKLVKSMEEMARLTAQM
jgi:hypothetical protein